MLERRFKNNIPMFDEMQYSFYILKMFLKPLKKRGFLNIQIFKSYNFCIFFG